MGLNLLFLDTNPVVVKQWKTTFKNAITVLERHQGLTLGPVRFSFFSSTIQDLLRKPDPEYPGKTAIMTPTNSLSYMGGGFDKYLLEALLETEEEQEFSNVLQYKQLETLVQNQSLQRFSGYIPVGTVNHIDLSQLGYNYQSSLAHKNWRVTTLLPVPSMVVPESLAKAEVASTIVNCLWNLLLTSEKIDITNLVIPGIGTGYGKLDPTQAARLMVSTSLLFNIHFEGPDTRINHLKKSVLILFFLNKNYTDLQNTYDIEELEQHVLSEAGKEAAKQLPKESLIVYDIPELLEFITFK